MEKIRVDVAWCDRNFGASLSENVPGAVVLTADTYEKLLHDVPQWLIDGDYELEYNLVDVATVLRAYEPFVSLAAISRATGINQHQLSHYATRKKKPRAEQRKRIVEGIHKIGRELMSVV